MSESKIRMFVVNDSENVTIKSSTANVHKDSNFDFITVDNSTSLTFEDNIINVLDSENVEKLLTAISSMKDSSINPKTGSTYQKDILNLLEKSKESENKISTYTVFKECTTLAAAWASVYPAAKEILGLFINMGE